MAFPRRMDKRLFALRTHTHGNSGQPDTPPGRGFTESVPAHSMPTTQTTHVTRHTKFALAFTPPKVEWLYVVHVAGVLTYSNIATGASAVAAMRVGISFNSGATWYDAPEALIQLNQTSGRQSGVSHLFDYNHVQAADLQIIGRIQSRMAIGGGTIQFQSGALSVSAIPTSYVAP